MIGRRPFVISKAIKYSFFAAAGLMGIILSGVLWIGFSPASSAYGADYLRKVIGDQPVTMMETTLFQTQDLVKKVEFGLGLAKADNPFGPTTPAKSQPSAQIPQEYSAISGGAKAVVQSPTKTIPKTNSPKDHLLITTGNQPASPAGREQGTTHTASSQPTATSVWMPPTVDASGSMPGSGEWQPYITDTTGRVVAYRTYVLPDPTRPYAYAAIVAFDLQNIRLHYVIGFSEPYAPGVDKTSKGVIPQADMLPGELLAAFNGGFKYVHGHFGSMANGLISVPPVDGLGTVALYQDGHIQIGVWNKDITPSDTLIAYRQNGPLVIENGAIGPRVGDALIWGRTISGGIVTWRSGLAISADNRTLYYFAGPSLSVTSLADAMLTVHPQAGIQLDINNFWVHFTAIRNNNGQLKAEALFPKSMRGELDRFLHAYPRDFFYITAAQP